MNNLTKNVTIKKNMDNKINNNPMEVSIMSERKYPVITISREFGAGGHSIARVVSERLGIPYYDRISQNRLLPEADIPRRILIVRVKI